MKIKVKGGGSCLDNLRCVYISLTAIYSFVALVLCLCLFKYNLFDDDDRDRGRDRPYNRTQRSSLDASTGGSSRPRPCFRGDLCFRILDRYIFKALLPAIFWPVVVILFSGYAIWKCSGEKRKDFRKSGRPLYCCGILLWQVGSNKTNKTRRGGGDSAGSFASQGDVEMTGSMPASTQHRAGGIPLS